MGFDRAKIEAGIADMIRQLEPKAQQPGHEGVLFRMQIALIPAFIRWKFDEIDRRTCQNAVCNAFVGFVSSQMAGIIADIEGDPTPATEAHFRLAQNLLQGMAEEVTAIFTGESSVRMLGVAAETVN